MGKNIKKIIVQIFVFVFPLACGAASISGAFDRLDLLIYDSSAFPHERPAPADIIIVAVDEQSILELGAWPWSRRRHAELVEWLSAAGAKVIALDIVFAEPDTSDPLGDAALAEAMAASGRVVLPVALEQLRDEGQPIEVLPLPALAQTAAALGHTDIEIDPDGRVRTTYLRAGLGRPVWVSLPQAMVDVASGLPAPGPEPRSLTGASPNPFVWVRADPMLIPFAGPAGHYRQISYVDVLRERIAMQRFKNAFVLVGATALTLGPRFSVPTTREGRLMTGVEINANILDGLRRGIAVRPLPDIGQLLLTVALVLVSAAIFAAIFPRVGSTYAAAPMTAVALLVVLLIHLLVLTELRMWFRPTAALFGVAVCFVFGLWRSLTGESPASIRHIARSRTMMQWVKNGIVVLDAAARIKYVNTIAAQTANAAAKQLVGKAVDDVFVFELADSRKPVEVRHLMSSIEYTETPLTVSLTVASRNAASARLSAYLMISGDTTGREQTAVLIVNPVADPREPRPPGGLKQQRFAFVSASGSTRPLLK